HGDFPEHCPSSRSRGFIFLELARVYQRGYSLLGCRQWYWHGLSSTAHSSWLSCAQSCRVFSGHLRKSVPRGWTNHLGGHAPDSSCPHRSHWRSAHAPRWYLVGAHWLDSGRQGTSL